MNDLYFACCSCKIYIDAGYRWAYWQLKEEGIVARGQAVDIANVLAADGYWHPPQDEHSRWLADDIFPGLRQFLQDHQSHCIVFGEDEDFAPSEADALEWMQIGYALMPTPRYLVEVIGLHTWDQVREYMAKQSTLPAWYAVTWWGNPSPQEKGRQKFEEIVRQQYNIGPRAV